MNAPAQDKQLKVLHEAKCPHCGQRFDMGINGTTNGCDECLGIVRNFAGQIVEEKDFGFLLEEEA